MSDKQAYVPDEQDKYPDPTEREATAPEHNPVNSPDPNAAGRHPSVGSTDPFICHDDTLLDGNSLYEKPGDSCEAGPSGAQDVPVTTRTPAALPPNIVETTGHSGTSHPSVLARSNVTAATISSPPHLPAPYNLSAPARPTRLIRCLVCLWRPAVNFGQWIRGALAQAFTEDPVRFCIIAVAGIAAVILVTATPPGVILSKSRGQSDPPGVYNKSKVTALSFRNAKNDTVRQVIWQNAMYELVTATHIEGTPGWVVRNINKSMKKGHYISVLPGSPLASSCPDFVNSTTPGEVDKFWTDIFFMTEGNTPNQIWTWNLPEKDADYHPNALSSYQAIFPTGFENGTSLTAYRDSCAGARCSESTRLFYQAGNRKVFMASSNVTNWSFWWTVELSRPPGNATANVGINTGPTVPLASGGGAGIQNIERGSPIAVTRVVPAKAGEGTQPSDMTIFVDSSDMMQQYTYSAASSTWTKGPNEWFLGPQLTPPDVVATSYALGIGQPLNNVLTAIVFENGTIGQHYWSVSQPDRYKSASPPNVRGVTALAIADDRAYCVVGDRIEEYRISWTDPASWTLMGNVPTAVGQK